MVTPEMLRAVLRYEPETGRLFWLDRTVDMVSGMVSNPEAWCASWNSTHSGREALTVRGKDGYLGGRALQRRFQAHRVAWAIACGAWPDQIDHINGVRDDNRLVNLRDVSVVENRRNARLYKRNTSGVSGVRLRGSRWEVEIGVGGRNAHLGSFADKDEAIAARRAAEARMGYHENHGRAV
jgi:hypothetical protein